MRECRLVRSDAGWEFHGVIDGADVALGVSAELMEEAAPRVIRHLATSFAMTEFAKPFTAAKEADDWIVAREIVGQMRVAQDEWESAFVVAFARRDEVDSAVPE